MSTLTGKIAVVTGGGQGLGKAICEVLGKSGATIICADLQVENAEAVVASLEEQGIAAHAFSLNVAEEESVQSLVGELKASFGRVDVLVNNAGTDVTKPVAELGVEEWDRVLQVNLRGPFLMLKHCLSLLQNAEQGHLVNIVSTAAKRTWSNAAAYHASKWGLLGLSHALHAELRVEGIKVSAVVAGGMRTPFILDRFPDTDPQVLQDPHNVAETVRFLLTLPSETVIPEVMVLPVRETSWP